jgi:hypothetical protein
MNRESFIKNTAAILEARGGGSGWLTGGFSRLNLMEYLYSLRLLGITNDFLISLYDHIAYNQCEGHLTTYEQFNFPGDPEGSRKADYCLPCQFVAAKAG